MIGKCGDDGKDFRLDPKIKDKVRKEFQRFCRL